MTHLYKDSAACDYLPTIETRRDTSATGVPPAALTIPAASVRVMDARRPVNATRESRRLAARAGGFTGGMVAETGAMRDERWRYKR